jgi:hypothetical protein
MVEIVGENTDQLLQKPVEGVRSSAASDPA